MPIAPRTTHRAPRTTHDALRPRWWQWPTVVSLDAPLVSVVWLLLFAHLAAMAMSGAPVFVLAASVWLAYAADRWLEAGRLSSS